MKLSLILCGVQTALLVGEIVLLVTNPSWSQLAILVWIVLMWVLTCQSTIKTYDLRHRDDKIAEKKESK